MRMKERIYQAFTGSRPNVLSRVLEDISPRETGTAKPKRKRLSDRTIQLIATAASIAILIGAATGGFLYFREYFSDPILHSGTPGTSETPATSTDSHPTDSKPTETTAPPTTQQTDPLPTDPLPTNPQPTDPNTPADSISEEEAKQIALVYTNYADDAVSGMTVVTDQSEACHRVSFDAEGVHFEISVSTINGKVLEVKLPIAARPQTTGSGIFEGYRGIWLKQGLTHTYDSPSQLKLYQLFGIGFDGESQKPTDEETAYLNTVWDTNWAELDLMRLPADKMDQVLQQYYGIRLEELDAACFDGLAYMESTDCYYYATGDVNTVDLCNFNAYRIETLSDGSLRVYYYQSYLPNDPQVVTLRQNDREWMILSNLRLEDITNPDSGEPDAPDGSISFWGAADLALAYTGFTKDSAYLQTITGNRIDDHYVIYLSGSDILYKVTVKAYHSFDILDFEMLPLVEGEMEYKFDSLLQDYTGWYNAALTHAFASAEELRLQQLFYSGFADEPSDFTEEELALLDGLYVDLMRLPKDKMDAVLQTYFGTSLSKLDADCFAGLMYLESTDCYYHAAGDTNRPSDVEIWSAEFVDFEILEVRYRLGSDEDAPFFILTLRYLPGGHWQILSNLQE